MDQDGGCRALARRYFERWDDRLTRLGVQLPPADFGQSCWHMFQVVLPDGTASIERYCRKVFAHPAFRASLSEREREMPH